MANLPDFTEEQLLLLAAAAFLANPARFTNADKDIPELRRMGNQICASLGRGSMGAEKLTPHENLMTRRMGQKPEMERRVKQAMRGAAVSERMLVVAQSTLKARMGADNYVACSPASADLKAAIKAALMEYGK